MMTMRLGICWTIAWYWKVKCWTYLLFVLYILSKFLLYDILSKHYYVFNYDTVYLLWCIVYCVCLKFIMWYTNSRWQAMDNNIFNSNSRIWLHVWSIIWILECICTAWRFGWCIVSLIIMFFCIVVCWYILLSYTWIYFDSIWSVLFILLLLSNMKFIAIIFIRVVSRNIVIYIFRCIQIFGTHRYK